MNNLDEKIQPEFEHGDTVTYMPYEKAFKATVLRHQYIGAAAHPDEVEYILDVEGMIGDHHKTIGTCRSIYESGMFRRSHTISWN